MDGEREKRQSIYGKRRKMEGGMGWRREEIGRIDRGGKG